ncbi:MAG: response regulator [Planctomycetota bacterium]
MARVLVVDDEVLVLRGLEQALRAAGHEVHAERDGRAAIARGARLQPAVLVTDWMLKSDLHGLHVVVALREVLPELRVILATGFGSIDLQTDANLRDVLLLEKPVSGAQARAAVAQVLAGPTPARSPRHGVLLLDAEGGVVHANEPARRLLGLAPDVVCKLSERIAPRPPLDLTAAGTWQPLLRRGEGAPLSLRVGGPEPDGTRFALLRGGEPGTSLGLVGLLLGLPEPGPEAWPYPGRVLVVDDNDLARRFGSMLLESVGATVYTAPTHGYALRLLEEDPGIALAILDFEMPDGDVGALIEAMRRARPDLVLVGNSGGERARDFEDRGVTRYLAKPWLLGDLVALLASSALGRRDAPERVGAPERRCADGAAE